MSDREEVISAAMALDGWLRRAQAEILWDRAADVGPNGVVVEIGSFQGKSTVVLASAAPAGATVYAIDPHAGNDRGPGEWYGAPEAGQADHQAFTENLVAFGVADRVRHVRELSRLAHPGVEGSIDLLYVDGAHGYRAALGDITGWGGRVAPGGVMVIHDVYTSVFVSMAVMRALWFSRHWRYLGRERSLAVYRRVQLSVPEATANLGRQAAGLPWFAKNLLVKSLDMVGLERLARLGHAPGGGIH